MIRRCRKRDIKPSEPRKKVCLYTKDGKRLLGRHVDKPSAYRQEAAIKARQKARGRKGKKRR